MSHALGNGLEVSFDQKTPRGQWPPVSMSHREAMPDGCIAETLRPPSGLEWSLGGRFFLSVSSLAAGSKLDRLILIGTFPREITQMPCSFPPQDIQSKREVELKIGAKVTESRVLILSSTI